MSQAKPSKSNPHSNSNTLSSKVEIDHLIYQATFGGRKQEKQEQAQKQNQSQEQSQSQGRERNQVQEQAQVSASKTQATYTIQAQVRFEIWQQALQQKIFLGSINNLYL